MRWKEPASLWGAFEQGIHGNKCIRGTLSSEQPRAQNKNANEFRNYIPGKTLSQRSNYQTLFFLFRVSFLSVGTLLRRGRGRGSTSSFSCESLLLTHQPIRIPVSTQINQPGSPQLALECNSFSRLRPGTGSCQSTSHLLARLSFKRLCSRAANSALDQDRQQEGQESNSTSIRVS